MAISGKPNAFSDQAKSSSPSFTTIPGSSDLLNGSVEGHFNTAVEHSRSGVGQVTKTTFAPDGMAGKVLGDVHPGQSSPSSEHNAAVAASRAQTYCATKDYPDAKGGARK